MAMIAVFAFAATESTVEASEKTETKVLHEFKDFSHWSIQVNGGFSQFDGDANQRLDQILSSSHLLWTVGLDVEYSFNPAWGLIANFQYIPYHGHTGSTKYGKNYFKGNMLLLDEKVRNELFGNSDKRIYTKVRDSAPTRYGKDAIVQNSFIADGCEIEGTVINCILFRGVRVAKGTVIKNSILMQDTIVGTSCNLDHVITDKNVSIRDRNNLMGCEKVPYYLGKYTTV